MMMQLAAYCRRRALGVVLSLAAACAGAPLAAQGMQTIDPDSAIDGDLAPNANGPQDSAPIIYDGIPTDPAPSTPAVPDPAYTEPAVTRASPSAGAGQAAADPAIAAAQGDTYRQDDLIGAAARPPFTSAPEITIPLSPSRFQASLPPGALHGTRRAVQDRCLIPCFTRRAVRA